MSEEEIVCRICGVETEFLAYVPNPYGEEIGGNDTEDWHCPECLRQSASDI